MEVSASIFCARTEARKASMDRTVTFFMASCCIRSGFWAGQMKPIRGLASAHLGPLRRSVGGRTLNTIPQLGGRWARMLAPAAR